MYQRKYALLLHKSTSVWPDDLYNAISEGLTYCRMLCRELWTVVAINQYFVYTAIAFTEGLQIYIGPMFIYIRKLGKVRIFTRGADFVQGVLLLLLLLLLLYYLNKLTTIKMISIIQLK